MHIGSSTWLCPEPFVKSVMGLAGFQALGRRRWFPSGLDTHASHSLSLCPGSLPLGLLAAGGGGGVCRPEIRGLLELWCCPPPRVTLRLPDSEAGSAPHQTLQGPGCSDSPHMGSSVLASRGLHTTRGQAGARHARVPRGAAGLAPDSRCSPPGGVCWPLHPLLGPACLLSSPRAGIPGPAACWLSGLGQLVTCPDLSLPVRVVAIMLVPTSWGCCRR